MRLLYLSFFEYASILNVISVIFVTQYMKTIPFLKFRRKKWHFVVIVEKEYLMTLGFVDHVENNLMEVFLNENLNR